MISVLIGFETKAAAQRPLYVTDSLLYFDLYESILALFRVKTRGLFGLRTTLLKCPLSYFES